MTILTKSFGYPKIGENRELKKALEAYWAKKITKEEFFEQAEKVDTERLQKQVNAKIDYISSNDFSLYDSMLDLSTMLGIIPERFSNLTDTTDIYFSMARGNDTATACEMTKWFDTNYHYIVPELNGKFEFKKNRPLNSFNWVKENFNVDTTPSLIGPFTFIKLAKGYEKNEFNKLVNELALVYNNLLKELEENGVKTVQLDEPALVLDTTDSEVQTLLSAYKTLTNGLNLNIQVQTYYESLSHYETIVNELPVNAIGLDFVVNNENLENIKKFGFPKEKQLIAGIVSGRDIWKSNYSEKISLVKELLELTNKEDLIISNSSPLFHLPVSLAKENAQLEEKLFSLLAFADERLEELTTIKNILNDGKEIPSQNFEEIRKSFVNQEVQDKMNTINENNIGRTASFEERFDAQQSVLNLPLFPTTTIGSYPQTADVRRKRTEFKKGLISEAEYKTFIREEIKKVIELQEELDLDVLVHGEFERTDMVEYFGQKLEGFAFTKGGWVQSYGSRCVKPPIIFGDVSRTNEMTVDEIVYAQSLTDRPVKGMLTGPVTILNWSFFRKDITKRDIAFQIALALKDEVLDLEKAGIKIIQIDEAAFREGMPLKKSKQDNYFDWAVKSFKLSNQDVKKETQIHTHMCYSEFNEILDKIYNMDSDVISIEASRSKGEIMEVFEKLNYNHGIGLGVYDIHSPRIPSKDEIETVIERSIKVIDKKLIWVNPDCGLKTRDYPETIPSLKNMVAVAKKVRETYLLKK